jgi:hypothetical protein
LTDCSRRALIFRHEHALVGGDVIPLELVAGIVAGIGRRWVNRAGMAQTPWGIPVLVGEARVLGDCLAGGRRITQAPAGIPDVAGQAWVAVRRLGSLRRRSGTGGGHLLVRREEIAIDHFYDQRRAGANRNGRDDGTTGYQYFPGDVVTAG